MPVRRVVLQGAAAALLAAALSSCGSDRDTSGFTVVNESAVTITARLTGTTTEVTVGPGEQDLIVTDTCLGGGVDVTSDAGSVAELSGAACPAEVLRVLDENSAVIEDLFG